ncbi:putative cytosolic protein [Granulibacter bethesdensis]|uniref:Ribonuclease VapC n=1 Tax=Granulibacter bethesdensis TaxID=364410 RepID=A0AAC9K8P5_9PROT|nr:type II toxin-antitoxin system VapC family toxin [Granulibacter bethesdensis]APH55420.1 putative cytosolic protein [Granulibacter bethesdensis]APH63006.1 putative cytosolic protein [Granulibacter bethesdensis]
MIIDTSALLAIVLGEPDGQRYLEALVSAERPRMSAANWLEASMMVEEKGGRLAGLRFDEFIRAAGIEIVPVSAEQATVARGAWRYFGRFRHAHRLNYGDCLAYALAKTEGDRLLYKGRDFDHTDIEPATQPEETVLQDIQD